MSKWLDDKGGLINWSASQAMVGLMKSKSLQARMAAIIARSTDVYRENKGALKEIVEQATQIAQASGRANYGTAIHEFAELLDAGTLDWTYVPDALKGPLEAYQITMEGLPTLASEVFVVVDEVCDGKEIRAAGSLDRVIQHPKLGAVVADIKGLSLDTALPTPTGWTSMGAVQVGDQLLGPDGRPCCVTMKSDVKRIGTYVVTFDDGSKVVCDTEHIWWTTTVADRRCGRGPSPRGMKEIIATITDGRQRQHCVPVTEPLRLPEQDLPIPPYLLGVWIGDGNRGRGVITKQDDLFDVLLQDGHKLGKRQVDSRSGAVTRTVFGLQAALRVSGLLGHKYVPDAYLRASCAQRMQLLQGLMDTDGTWNTARGTAVFNTADKALALQVEELLLTLGQRPHVAAVDTTGFGKRVTSYAVQFSPIDLMPFRLPRKAEKVVGRNVTKSTRRLIVSVTPGPDVDTACVAVDSPTHVYLCTERMIPTHNTGTDEPKYPLATTTQVAIYSRGRRYRDHDFPGSPAFEGGVRNVDDTAWRAPIVEDLNTDVGVLIHCPLEKVNGVYVCGLYALPLERGWQSLLLGHAVQSARRPPALKRLEKL